MAYFSPVQLINTCISLAVFHLSEASHVTLPLTQTDCLDCRQLKVRHDKQH